MNRKIVVLLLISIMMAVGLALGLAGAGPAAADKGGCPNEAASKGAAHANTNSAHDTERRAARECSPQEPTPDPTPTPAPAGLADVQVVAVSVSTPVTASSEGQFAIRVGVNLLNAGPADTALVDTTFTFTVPSVCSISPAGTVTVEDSWLPKGVGVYISRGWIVTCLGPGAHEVTANVSAAIDPAQPVSDPDTGNNAGSATVTLHVGS